jgi:hypothetical protein
MQGRRLVHRGLLIGALLAVGFSGSKAHAEVLEANCPPSFTMTSVSRGADQRLAQTFTAIRTGSVVRAQAWINKVTAGANFELQILATDATGKPVNGILGSATIPDATVPLIASGTTRVAGTFSSPAGVVAGQQYALVVSRPGGTEFLVAERSGNPCPGREFTSSSQTNPFVAEDITFDAVFQVFVEPASPVKPSNQFTIGKLKGRKLTLVVPGPGSIDVTDAAATRSADAIDAARKKVLKPSQASAAGPGKATVTLRLTSVAKRLLRTRGKVKARTAITFTPTGGDPNTQRAKLKLKPKQRK